MLLCTKSLFLHRFTTKGIQNENVYTAGAYNIWPLISGCLLQFLPHFYQVNLSGLDKSRYGTMASLYLLRLSNRWLLVGCIKFFFRAGWDYRAGERNELSFCEGDMILLLVKHNDDWWEGTLDITTLKLYITTLSNRFST